MLAVVLALLFGSPEAAFAARVRHAVDALCPCHRDPRPGCEATHARATAAIAVVALDARDPEEAAARLLGTMAHETCARHERQLGGGPAIGWWQLEVPARERAALLADPVAAARVALSRAGGDLSAYAGAPGQTAAELRRYVASARYALAW
jgi:hypothetical protein